MALDQADRNQGQGLFGSREAAEAWRRMEASRLETLGRATEMMIDLAEMGPGSRVLDVAAGTGDQTILAARRVGPTGFVLATDISASMLEVAVDAVRTAGLSNVETRVMDARSLDLADESFDAAISRNGIMLMPDWSKALSEIRRVLKPGKRLSAITFSALEKNPYFAIQEAVARRRAGLVPEPGAAGQFALGDPTALAHAFTEAGFRDVEVHEVPTTRRAGSAAEVVKSMKERAITSELVAAMVANLDARGLELAWAEIEAELRQFEGPDGLVIPGESLIGVGTR